MLGILWLLKKAKENEFLIFAFKELISFQNDGQEVNYLKKSIYNLEIAIDKKSKEEFYEFMTKCNWW